MFFNTTTGISQDAKPGDMTKTELNSLIKAAQEKYEIPGDFVLSLYDDKLIFYNKKQNKESNTCSSVLNPPAPAPQAPPPPAPARPAPAPPAPASSKPYHPPAQFTDTSDLEERKRLQQEFEEAQKPQSAQQNQQPIKEETSVFEKALTIVNNLEKEKEIIQKKKLLAQATADEEAEKEVEERRQAAIANYEKENNLQEAAEARGAANAEKTAREQAEKQEAARIEKEEAEKRRKEREKQAEINRQQQEAQIQAKVEAAEKENKKIQERAVILPNPDPTLERSDASLLKFTGNPKAPLNQTMSQLTTEPGKISKNLIKELPIGWEPIKESNDTHSYRNTIDSSIQSNFPSRPASEVANLRAQAAPAQQPQQTQAAQPPQASAAQQAQPQQASAAQQAQPLKAAAAPVTFEQELASKVAGRKFYLNPDFGKSAGDAIEPNMRYVNGLGEYVNEIPTGATEPTENYQPNFVGGNKANKKHRHNNKNKNKNNKKKVSINKSKKSTFNKKTRRNKKNKNKE